MQTANQIIRHVQRQLSRLQLTDKRLLVAVSGGADSMALAYVISRAAGPSNCHAVTVDHGFRPESAQEAQDVGRFMSGLGISHEVRRLRWSSEDGASSPLPTIHKMEEVARERRYHELGAVCREQGIHAVLTGHHADDQAETFLLRFMRQSGVYGMAGMLAQASFPVVQNRSSHFSRDWPELVVVRPLLNIDKQAIYNMCRSKGIRWHEDSSNTDTRIRRNKLRQLISSRINSTESPFNKQNILDICLGMQRHRAYINEKATGLLSDYAKLDLSTGTVVLQAKVHGSGHSATSLPHWARNAALHERVIASTVGWIRGRSQPPELVHLRRFMDAIVDYYKANLHDDPSNEHSKSIITAISTAGVSLYPPTKKRGWLFCRQKPRAGEIEKCGDNSLGDLVVWDRRIAVSVRSSNSSSAISTDLANMRWSVHALVDCAKQPWYDKIDRHKRLIQKARKHLEPSAVQATQPVVCVEIPYEDGGMHGTRVCPIYAFGYTVADTLEARRLSVEMHMLCKTPSTGAFEVVAAL